MSFERPPYIEEIRRQVRETSEKQKQKLALRTKLARDPENDLFRIKPADKWLNEEYAKPAARKLLGTLWYEHELCILFADTNLGKSVLAVQIGRDLAKQNGLEPFGSETDEPLRVLYVDFELSAGQFKARYSDRITTHNFSPHFFRAEFNPGGDNPMLYDKYTDYVKEHLELAIQQTKPAVLIIDNITCMGSATASAGGAVPLMKTLKALKITYNLSMLVLAHTPKRNAYKPITVNDLQGSKMIINFADSAFAIGQSQQDPSLRYIKQVKQRSNGTDYGAANVALYRIEKNYDFLGFHFQGYDHEAHHLQKVGTALSEEVKNRIPELVRQGLTLRRIADHLKISVSSVKRVLDKVKEET